MRLLAEIDSESGEVLSFSPFRENNKKIAKKRIVNGTREYYQVDVIFLETDYDINLIGKKYNFQTQTFEN